MQQHQRDTEIAFRRLPLTRESQSDDGLELVDFDDHESSCQGRYQSLRMHAELAEASSQISAHLLAALYHLSAAWSSSMRLVFKGAGYALGSARRIASKPLARLRICSGESHLSARLIDHRVLLLLSSALDRIHRPAMVVKETCNRLSEAAKHKVLSLIEQYLEQILVNTDRPLVKRILSSLVFVPDRGLSADNSYGARSSVEPRPETHSRAKGLSPVPSNDQLRQSSKEAVVASHTRVQVTIHIPDPSSSAAPETHWIPQSSQETINYSSSSYSDAFIQRSPSFEYATLSTRSPIPSFAPSTSASLFQSRRSSRSVASSATVISPRPWAK